MKKGYLKTDSLDQNIFTPLNPVLRSPAFFQLFWEEFRYVCHRVLPCDDLPGVFLHSIHDRYAIWRIFPWQLLHQKGQVRRREEGVSDIIPLYSSKCDGPYRSVEHLYAASQAPSDGQAVLKQEQLKDCMYRFSE